MIELADVFRRFADGYLSAHGAAMPASLRAIADILENSQHADGAADELGAWASSMMASAAAFISRA